jgi:hypothetical protein
LFGSPGLVLGAMAGAFAWRKRRWTGALLGAVTGFVVWLSGLIWMKSLM